MPASSVDDYIAAQPAEAQVRLRELRAVIRDTIPEAREIISYGMPAYRLPVGVVTYFGAAKNHCALYGLVPEGFADELSGYERSKGAVRFPLDQPIPADLVRRMVLARVADREATRKR